jgi:hypothetical protein
MMALCLVSQGQWSSVIAAGMMRTLQIRVSDQFQYIFGGCSTTHVDLTFGSRQLQEINCLQPQLKECKQRENAIRMSVNKKFRPFGAFQKSEQLKCWIHKGTRAFFYKKAIFEILSHKRFGFSALKIRNFP